jgi:ribosomal RNA-processing protein 7
LGYSVSSAAKSFLLSKKLTRRQGYLNHYELMYPPKEILIRTVNEYMTAYTDREAAQVLMAARKRHEPDEDGFVTVTRGGRIGAANPEQAARRLEREKERQKGYNDFYRFQFREERKEKAAELIRKFEEDRAKVKRMKEQRTKFQVCDAEDPANE